MKVYKMWIGGKWVAAESGKTFDALNPSTGELVGQVPLGGKADVDKAVEAARQALRIWSKKSQAERSEALYRIAGVIAAHTKELAELDSATRGAPSKTAHIDPSVMVQTFKYAAQVSRSFTGQYIPANPAKVVYLQHEPRGVCALYVSWNGSLISSAKKLSAALATGNNCIVKAPTLASLTVLKLAEDLEEAGLPAGTVNMITGPGGSMGEALAAHPGVNMISLTGGTETGKRILAIAGETVKYVGLELGGKNPSIVMEDADINATIGSSMFLSFGNSGMTCASIGRCYVQENIYDQFVAEAKKIVVGDPNDEKTTMGPVMSAEHRDKVEALVKSGIIEGAQLVLGGKRPTNPPLDTGFYVMPTVFTNVTQNMRIAREEVFGPVACFLKFSTPDDAVAMANDTNYGLVTYIWTKDIPRGIKMANQIQSGSVSINGNAMGVEYPWGGYKESGLGKENSLLGFEEYVQVKLISFELPR
jgi:acyl-CoA reductase-like NAD-dependent aldehyde dehydrogenase